MERDNQTVMNLIDILDLSEKDGTLVKNVVEKEGLLKFVNGKGQENLSDEVVEKMGALHEILLLVQDDAFLIGGDLSDK